jgi:DNA primase
MSVIEDVVARYVDLKPADQQNLKGRCPFCSADESLFYVSPAKGVYTCFDCQESGDQISFLMWIAEVDYLTAVQMLEGRPS